MFDFLKKDVSAAVNDRIKSPLFGTFILTWIAWNWRIFYSTFFVESEKLGGGRLKFIEKLLADHTNSIWGPIFSTIIIICLVPFLRIGAFWVEESFKRMRNDLARKFSEKEWIPPAMATNLRRQVREQEDKYEDLLSKKDTQIAKMQVNIVDLEKSNASSLKELEAIRLDNKKIQLMAGDSDTLKQELELKIQELEGNTKKLENEVAKLQSELEDYETHPIESSPDEIFNLERHLMLSIQEGNHKGYRISELMNELIKHEGKIHFLKTFRSDNVQDENVMAIPLKNFIEEYALADKNKYGDILFYTLTPLGVSYRDYLKNNPHG